MPSGSTVYVEVTPAAPVTTVAASTGLPDLRGFGANQAKAQLEASGYVVTIQPVAPPAGAVGANGAALVAGQVWQSVPAAGQTPTDNNVTLSFVPASAGSPGR